MRTAERWVSADELLPQLEAPAAMLALPRNNSIGQPERFVSVHGVVQNFFRIGRHLLRAKDYRLFRDRSL
jgi:hypothetical protein